MRTGGDSKEFIDYQDFKDNKTSYNIREHLIKTNFQSSNQSILNSTTSKFTELGTTQPSLLSCRILLLVYMLLYPQVVFIEEYRWICVVTSP